MEPLCSSFITAPVRWFGTRILLLTFKNLCILVHIMSINNKEQTRVSCSLPQMQETISQFSPGVMGMNVNFSNVFINTRNEKGSQSKSGLCLYSS